LAKQVDSAGWRAIEVSRIATIKFDAGVTTIVGKPPFASLLANHLAAGVERERRLGVQEISVSGTSAD